MSKTIKANGDKVYNAGMITTGATAAQPIIGGVLTVYFWGDLIALIDERGEIVWRNTRAPSYLARYIILQYLAGGSRNAGLN